MKRIADIAAERGKDEVQLILELLEEKRTVAAVAQNLGISVSGLFRFLKRKGFSRKVVIRWSHPTKSKA